MTLDRACSVKGAVLSRCVSVPERGQSFGQGFPRSREKDGRKTPPKLRKFLSRQTRVAILEPRSKTQAGISTGRELASGCNSNYIICCLKHTLPPCRAPKIHCMRLNFPLITSTDQYTAPQIFTTMTQKRANIPRRHEYRTFKPK